MDPAMEVFLTQMTQLIAGMNQMGAHHRPQGQHPNMHQLLMNTPSFDGSEKNYGDWVFSMRSYMAAVNPGKGSEILRWAQGKTHEIEESQAKAAFVNHEDFASMVTIQAQLKLMLNHALRGEALSIVRSVPETHVLPGVEAWRLITARYEPRGAGTKRALLKKIVTQGQCTKWENLESKIREMENNCNKYKELSGANLPDDLRVCFLIDLCPKDLQTHIEMNQGDKDYLDVREEIMAHLNRKRASNDMGLKQMEIDEVDQWHGYEEGDEVDQWHGYGQANELIGYEEGETELSEFEKGYGKKAGSKGYGKSYSHGKS